MIGYSKQKDFREDELATLFLSVGWSSGNYPNRLAAALRNSDGVCSAWEGDRLVGLVNALSDGAMVVYFHYLLVHPDYQRRGIGKRLLDCMLEEYGDCMKVLIAYDAQIGFYERAGFRVGEAKTSMSISGRWHRLLGDSPP